MTLIWLAALVPVTAGGITVFAVARDRTGLPQGSIVYEDKGQCFETLNTFKHPFADGRPQVISRTAYDRYWRNTAWMWAGGALAVVSGVLALWRLICWDWSRKGVLWSPPRPGSPRRLLVFVSTLAIVSGFGVLVSVLMIHLGCGLPNGWRPVSENGAYYYVSRGDPPRDDRAKYVLPEAMFQRMRFFHIIAGVFAVVAISVVGSVIAYTLWHSYGGAQFRTRWLGGSICNRRREEDCAQR